MDKAPRILPILLLGVILLLTVSVPASAATFCVNTATALQNALITAATNGEDDDILIVRGTYVGNFTYSSSEENVLYVLGGYNANCTNSYSNPANTVLDGNQSGRVFLLSGGSNSEFLIYGLTLRNGKIAGHGGGLAMACSNCAATVENNRIINNESSGYGGGASIYGVSDAVDIINNTFFGNHGSAGGGLYLDCPGAARITNNVFRRNTADAGGGAVRMYQTSSLVSNNSFVNNEAGYGGGIDVYYKGGIQYQVQHLLVNGTVGLA